VGGVTDGAGRTFESTRVSAATVRSDVCEVTSIRAVDPRIHAREFSQNSAKSRRLIGHWC